MAPVQVRSQTRWPALSLRGGGRLRGRINPASPAGMALQWRKPYFLPGRRFASSAEALRVAVAVANA